MGSKGLDRARSLRPCAENDVDKDQDGEVVQELPVARETSPTRHILPRIARD